MQGNFTIHTADECGKSQGMHQLVHEDILKRTVE